MPYIDNMLMKHDEFVSRYGRGYALLADLQSTTSHISNYQQGSQGSSIASPTTTSVTATETTTYSTGTPNVHIATSGSGTDASSRESTPPPLPPPPPKDVVESMHQEPLYEVQQVKTVSSSNSKEQPSFSRSYGPPPIAAKPQQVTAQHSNLQHSAHQHSNLQHSAPQQSNLQHSAPQQSNLQHSAPRLAPKPMSSSLSSNLSELDMLLQDLSSAQFMAEVDRRNAANVSYDGNPGNTTAQQAPVISTKPTQERTVDSLLFELENTVPSQSSTSQSVPVAEVPSPSYTSQPTHYEAVHPAPRPTGHPQSRGGMAYVQTVSAADEGLPPPAVMTTSGNASTATRELEDLMASLSEFKVSGGPQHVQGIPPVQTHVGDPPYALPHKIPKSGAMPSSSGASGANAEDSINPIPVAMGAQDAGVSQPDGAVGSQSAYQDGTYHVQAASQGVLSSSVAASQLSGTSGSAAENNNLDAMLGNLHTDMTRQGIMTVPKGHCAACAKPIIGQVITALGKIWHPEHFACVHCKEELGTRNFFERDGQPYCEQDYHNLFSPRCAHCSGPILDKCVTALDKSWHPEHFFCAQCGRLFGDEGFHEKDGKAYCREDYFDMFAPKCGGCLRPIMDNYISALSRQWHPECFICQECHIPFGGGSFFDHEGMPYCETHYHAKRGSLCAGCHKPITGRCITAMYKKFHPEHFVCAFCLKQLNKGTFKEQNEKPYCHPCFVKLFG